MQKHDTDMFRCKVMLHGDFCQALRILSMTVIDQAKSNYF